jgi:hypothetical protein
MTRLESSFCARLHPRPHSGAEPIVPKAACERCHESNQRVNMVGGRDTGGTNDIDDRRDQHVWETRIIRKEKTAVCHSLLRAGAMGARVWQRFHRHHSGRGCLLATCVRKSKGNSEQHLLVHCSWFVNDAWSSFLISLLRETRVKKDVPLRCVSLACLTFVDTCHKHSAIIRTT